jgi:hypothetical protein
MTTRGGDLLVWFGKGGEALKRGEWTWIKATPKEHSEYRDVKQTVVSRLSVMTEDEIAKMNKPKRAKKVKVAA